MRTPTLALLLTLAVPAGAVARAVARAGPGAAASSPAAATSRPGSSRPAHVRRAEARSAAGAKQQLEFRGELSRSSSSRRTRWCGAAARRTCPPRSSSRRCARASRASRARTSRSGLAGDRVAAPARRSPAAASCAAATTRPRRRSPSFAQKRADDWARRWPELGRGGPALRQRRRCRRARGREGLERGCVAPWRCACVAVDGARARMHARRGARGKPQVAPVAAGEPLPEGANAPVYYPSREAPIVACGRLERIAAPGRARADRGVAALRALLRRGEVARRASAAGAPVLRIPLRLPLSVSAAWR